MFMTRMLNILFSQMKLDITTQFTNMKRYTLDGYSSLRARYLVSYPAERMTWTDAFHQGQISPKPPSAIF